MSRLNATVTPHRFVPFALGFLVYLRVVVLLAQAGPPPLRP
jgi:hypothetical protein